jgi:hypothetical protein
VPKSTGPLAPRCARATGRRGRCTGRTPPLSAPGARAARSPLSGIVTGHVEAGRLGHALVGERDFVLPQLPRLRDHLRVRDRTIEVAVRFELQREQGQRGGLHGTASQVGGVEAGALELQRQALTAEELDQGGTLAPGDGPPSRGSAARSMNMSALLVGLMSAIAEGPHRIHHRFRVRCAGETSADRRW